MLTVHRLEALCQDEGQGLVARGMVQDFRWLSQGSYNLLFDAVSVVCPYPTALDDETSLSWQAQDLVEVSMRDWPSQSLREPIEKILDRYRAVLCESEAEG